MSISQFPGELYKSIHPGQNDQDALESYRLGLLYTEKVILNDPKTFFDQDPKKLGEEFLFLHMMFCAHEPMIDPGKLREQSRTVLRENSFGQLKAQIYPSPNSLSECLDALVMNIKKVGHEILNGTWKPLYGAVFLHQWIENMKPFEKRNRLMARVWMNVMLQLGGIEAISFDDQQTYKKAVHQGPDPLEAEIRKQILEKQ